MDLCWNVPTLGKCFEKFPCKATIHSCPENGATHDLLYVERPRKILCCNCNGFLQQKGSISFARFVTLWLVVPPIFTTNMIATILYIWTWIDFFWNILVKVKRTKCAAYSFRIFMCMSDSCLPYGPLLARLSLKRRHNNSYSLPSHVKWNTEIGILAC